MSSPYDPLIAELLASCELLAAAMEQTLETTRQLAEAPAAGCIPSVTEARHALQQIELNKAQLARFRTMVANYKKLITVH